MPDALELVPRKDPSLLSFVVPLYNEREVFPLLQTRLLEVASRLPCPCEFLLVNDGSRDGTASLIFEWAAADSRVKGLDLSRNFGHQAAVTAGIDHCVGDAVVILDADLQDPPEIVFQMLAHYREGYDVVYAQRSRRHGETFLKQLTAKGFYWLMRRFVHKDLPENTGDFRLMSRDAALALIHLREGQRFIRGMVTWLGFAQKAVLFERPARAAGETKYPWRKMIRFAWDAVLSFSSAPLRLGIYLGGAVFLLGVGMGFYALIRKLIGHHLVPGWPTIIVLQCAIGGAILFSLGLIGEYVGRIYDEIKHRPIYIVRRSTNLGPRFLPARAVSSQSLQIVPEQPREGRV